MQRRHVSFIVVSLLSLVLCSCEEWRVILSEWNEHQQEPSDDIPTPPAPSVESGEWAYDLGNHMLAVATPLGVQIVDVSDAGSPRSVAEFRLDPMATIYALHHSGDSLALIVSKGWEYWGTRSEITATRQQQIAVLTLDIRDRANPVLIDTWVLTGNIYKESRLRQSAQGAELYIHTSGIADVSGDRLEWLQLRDGRWSEPQYQYIRGPYHSAATANIVSATPKWLVIYSAQALEAVQVWRIDGGQPVAKRFLTGGSYFFTDSETQVSGDMFHIPYLTYVNDDYRFVIDSYLLGEDAAGDQGSSPIGSCDVMDLLSEPNDNVTVGPSTVHFIGPDLFEIAVSSAGSPERRRFTIDEQGACHAVVAPSECSDRPPIASAEQVSGFYPIGPGQSVAIESAHGSSAQVLSLYGTSEQSCLAPSASATLAAPILGVHATRLARSETAPDGTRETSLLSLPCYDPIAGNRGCFQLLSHSDHTLTPRANIALPGRAAGSFLLPHAKLALATNLFVNTYDLRRLDAPRELGSLQLAAYYPALFDFGDHIARIQTSRYGELPDQIEVLLLTAAGEHDQLIAHVDTGPSGEWHRLDRLLVKTERHLDSSTQRLDFVLQVYDLSEPTRPRRAGRLEIDPARFPSVAQYDGGRAVGHALVYAYPSSTADGSVTFDSIDLRDPDAPELNTGFVMELPSAGQDWTTEYVSGSTLYQSALTFQSDGLPRTGMRSVDFADPRAPVRSPVSVLPGAVRLVLGQDLYVYSDFATGTVIRLRLVNGVAEQQATGSFPDFYSHWGYVPEIETDHAGHLFVLYQTGDYTTAHLFVLDDQTLDVLAMLPTDSEAGKPRYSNGRLLIEGPGVSFVVDVHEPASPRVTSYLRIYQSSTLFIGDRIFAYGGYGLRTFDASLQNLF